MSSNVNKSTKMTSTGKKPISYADGISLMMFGFADNPHPDPETVKLVESVVLKQLRDVLQEASKQAENRHSKIIEPEDLVFQLRHDKMKMRRFIKYLTYKYTEIPSLHKKSRHVETPPKKIYTDLMAFIKKIDESGQLSNIEAFDGVKYQRALRAERVSSTLDEEKYREYSRARQISFSCKQFSQGTKFQDWVDPKQELTMSANAIEILEIFAYNIVGHIVDMGFIIRQDMKQKRENPLAYLYGNYYNPAMFSAPHLPRPQVFPHKHNQVTLGQAPLTVREIREAMRRCYCPQVGVVNLNKKSSFKIRPFLM